MSWYMVKKEALVEAPPEKKPEPKIPPKAKYGVLKLVTTYNPYSSIRNYEQGTKEWAVFPYPTLEKAKEAAMASPDSEVVELKILGTVKPVLVEVNS